jgi:8-oxo-dGTP pyrophosphatase MutT (NUDIX family)
MSNGKYEDKKTSVVRQFSAGGAVFKKEDGKILWLLVQPKRGDDFHNQIRWQLPKGWLKEREKSEEAALREVEEEGGVKAEIIDKIDTIKIFFKNTFEGKPKETVLKTITFFLMEYKEDIKEGFGWETQEVAWLPFDQAKEKLTFKSEKEILEKAQKILESSKTREKLF